MGETAYVIVRHGEQPAELLDYVSNPVNGRPDDLIRITGFRVKASSTGVRETRQGPA